MSVERKKGTAAEEKFPKGVFIALAVIVFVSGFCSLAYQVVWLREFRLIFGGAAPAASAVLAVFMGGLGLGGLYLGKRVERAEHPGRYYAWVEGLITLATVLSPLLMILIQKAYIATGGVQTLGLVLATGLQILMTAIVIGPACFMMGGTLPAALRVVQSDNDSRRMTTALFYGVNVAGAVTGAYLATFVFLQNWGNLWTLLVACGVNALIAAWAYVLLRDRKRESEAVDVVMEKKKGKAMVVPSPALPAWFFPGAAFLSGFAFFLIELVWYRASIPLFGGSVYNFGLILAVALAGIGSGSLLYSLVLRRIEPSLGLFAVISGLLALCIIVPFAMGDRLAHAALLLNNYFIPRSFDGLVLGWTCICVVLVFLPAFFSGIQFPLLISLIGQGGRNISEQLGRVYAWNTLGAVSGALIGGFVLLPQLSITGSWRAAALFALLISVIALVMRRRSDGGKSAGRRSARMAMVLGLLTIWVTFGAAGPSAYWLHHPIGYGRANALYGASENDWISYVNSVNRSLIAAKDGRETSAAVTSLEDYSILSNGKSDSSAIGDSSTTIMLGLIGSILHPSEVKTACVVGYGTGITAGWMVKVEGLERLDIIELESAIIDLGEYFKRTNFDVAHSPKARLVEGDAREVLMTRPQKYDLIVSEPSNLHRAGVANLYTQEFYRSVSARLNQGGLFCQWVQSYETDMESVQLVIATLSSIFPKVELWQAGAGDLLLVCSEENEPWQLAKVRERMKQEPFATGVRNLWGTVTAEGLFARAVANADYARYVSKKTTLLNTDDLNHLEFWFAHNLGVRSEPVMDRLLEEAYARGELLPEIDGDGQAFDKEQWAAEFVWRGVFLDAKVILPRPVSGQTAWPKQVMDQFDFAEKLPKMSPKEQAVEWPVPVMTETSRLMWLSVLANNSDPRFEQEIESLRETWPLEYHILYAEYDAARGKSKEALQRYFQAVRMSKKHPIIRHGYYRVMWQGIERMIKQVEFTSYEELVNYFELAATPSAFAGLTDVQRRVLISLSMPIELEYQVRAAEAWGRYPEWNEQVLRFQRDVYQRAQHPDAALAARHYEQWQKSVRRGALEATGSK
jgi:spermidine synthase